MNASALDVVQSKQEITEVLTRYCRAMDRIDDDLGYTVFWEDSVADYGDIFQGTGHGFIDFVHQTHLGLVAHSHQISNILIEVDGDEATSETYVSARFLLPSPEGEQNTAISHGRYLDRWSRRDDRWAIAHRSYIHDWDEGFQPNTSLNPRASSRDRDDPSYTFLKRAGVSQVGAASDELLIRRTLALYGPLLDDRRFEAWGELFTEDAEWIIPGVSFAGRANIVSGVGAMEPPVPGLVKHLSYPPVIAIQSANAARAWSDLVAMVRDQETGAWTVVASGRYVDELRKEGGIWRFRVRIADIDVANDPMKDLPPVPSP